MEEIRCISGPQRCDCCLIRRCLHVTLRNEVANYVEPSCEMQLEDVVIRSPFVGDAVEVKTVMTTE